MQDQLDYLIQQGINKYGITSPQQQSALAQMIYTYAEYLKDVTTPSFVDKHSAELELKRDSASVELLNYPEAYALEQAFEHIAEEHLTNYRAKVLFDNNINAGPDLEGIIPVENVPKPVEEIVVELKQEEVQPEVIQEKQEVIPAEPQITNTQLLEMIQLLTEEIKALKTESVKEETEKPVQEEVITTVEDEVKQEEVIAENPTETVKEETSEEVKVLDENLEPVV